MHFMQYRAMLKRSKVRIVSITQAFGDAFHIGANANRRVGGEAFGEVALVGHEHRQAVGPRFQHRHRQALDGIQQPAPSDEEPVTAAGHLPLDDHLPGGRQGLRRGEGGLPRDPDQARRLYESACKQNYAASCTALGNTP